MMQIPETPVFAQATAPASLPKPHNRPAAYAKTAPAAESHLLILLLLAAIVLVVIITLLVVLHT